MEIQITNFLGVQEVAIPLGNVPVAITGPNASGQDITRYGVRRHPRPRRQPARARGDEAALHERRGRHR